MMMTLGVNNASNFAAMYNRLAQEKKLDAAAPKTASLGMSMIGRVHRAKPGCSSCGGK